MLFWFILCLVWALSLEHFSTFSRIPSANVQTGLFLLRRSSPMSSLEAEVSQTTGKAIRLLISPYATLRVRLQVRRAKLSGGRETKAPLAQLIQVLHSSHHWPSQAALSCPQDFQYHGENWVSSADGDTLQPALGIAECEWESHLQADWNKHMCAFARNHTRSFRYRQELHHM